MSDFFSFKEFGFSSRSSFSISPFLENCDADDDHRITMKEWGKCLGLEDGDLEEKCEEILGSKENTLKSNEV